MNFTFKKGFAASVLSVGLLFPLSSNVLAEPSNELSTAASLENFQAITQSFDQNGIDEATQEKLIEKVKNGELLDSLNPQKASEGITTTDYEKSVAGSEPLEGYTSKTVFPDGSFITMKVTPTKVTPYDEENDGITPQDVTPGSGSVCGSGYCNIVDAKVSYDTGVIYAEFLANYTIANGGYDSITKVYQPKVKIWLGSYSNLQKPVIDRGTETYYQSAKASMTWTYISPTGTAQQFLILNVQNDKATASVN